MPKDDSNTNEPSLLDKAKSAVGDAMAGLAQSEAGKKATAAATRATAKAAASEVSRRAKAAVDGVLDDAEDWVSQEAGAAEARRAASGLPDTVGSDPEWAAGLHEAGDAAYQRGRTLADPAPEDDAPPDEKRLAAARDELARLKEALGRGGAIGGADDILARASAARAAAVEDDDAWPEGSLEAVAGVPTHAPVANLDADLDALAEAAARDSRAGQPKTAPTEAPTASTAATTAPTAANTDGDRDAHVTLVPVEQDPALAALEAARAARRAAATEGELDLGLEPAAEVPVDPVKRALAMAREARQESGAVASDEVDEARREGRARAERIANPPSSSLMRRGRLSTTATSRNVCQTGLSLHVNKMPWS